jgi:hypothetical protein
MKDWLKGCHFKATADVQMALKIMLQIQQGGFHQSFKELYEH